MILLGKTSKATPVGEIMTTNVVCVEPGWTADECMALMTEKHIRHLPVVESGRLVGVVSIGDAVRAVVDEQQFTIKALERYLVSGGGLGRFRGSRFKVQGSGSGFRVRVQGSRGSGPSRPF